MFGFLKKNKGGKNKKPSREELIADAKANAARARADIGQENIEKMAAALRQEEMSEGKKAQERVKNMDKEKVADHLKIMIDEDKA